MSNFWDIKQAVAPKTLDIYIYSEVESDSYDWWTGETIQSETSASVFRDKLEVAGQIDQINIYINSIGGSVMEGTAIYNQLKRHPAQKTVYIDGFACSVSSVIAMAGDKVIMPKNTTMMIHNMWMGCCGNAKELRKAADNLDTMMESNRQAYLQKAGDKLDEQRLIEMLDSETWLTAEQCIEYGLADEYAASEIDLEQAKQIFDTVNQSAMKQKYECFVAKVKEPPKEKAPIETEPLKPEPKPTQKSVKAEKIMSAFIKAMKI